MLVTILCDYLHYGCAAIAAFSSIFLATTVERANSEAQECRRVERAIAIRRRQNDYIQNDYIQNDYIQDNETQKNNVQYDRTQNNNMYIDSLPS
jgi:hypothetical protein